MPVSCAEKKYRRFTRQILSLLFWLFMAHAVRADPFLNRIEKATPNNRVILLLNYFDTCRAVTQNQTNAFRLLHAVDAFGKQKQDEQLRQYVRFTKDTFAKHHQTNAQNAALFLTVGERATDDDDPQIAAVCRHFVGQYYYLNEEYGKAFEHLLAANRALQKIGYEHVPEISRYLYELAFNYYYFDEYEKVIPLLEEATRHPAFNANMAIQNYNTMGMAYSWLAATNDSTLFAKAENRYRKASALARLYGDSVWVGITTGNLANTYYNQHKWAKALRYFRDSYRIGLKFGGAIFSPNGEALEIASLHLRLGNRDSCLHYLNQAKTLSTLTGNGNRFEDEAFQKNYYDVARKYYQAVGNLTRAYALLDSLTVLDKRINKRYKSEQLSLVNQKLLIQKHQAEVEAIEVEKKAEQTRFWLVVVVLVLLAGLFVRLYYLSQIRRKQERVIEAQKEKSLRLEKQMVEDELRRANADLAGFMDNLRQKDALIDIITAQLENRAEPLSTDSETYQNLIDSSLLTNDDWDEFRRRFERVHPGFFWELKSHLPGLTPAEERLLALSQLRIDTRQMSRMLGISPHSIRMTRYRLRKKMGVDGHSPLSELLTEAPDDSVTS